MKKKKKNALSFVEFDFVMYDTQYNFKTILVYAHRWTLIMLLVDWCNYKALLAIIW